MAVQVTVIMPNNVVTRWHVSFVVRCLATYEGVDAQGRFSCQPRGSSGMAPGILVEVNDHDPCQIRARHRGQVLV